MIAMVKSPTKTQLHEAAALLRSERRKEAAAMLKAILQADQQNIEAWWLMAQAVDVPDIRERCIDRILALDPLHSGALAYCQHGQFIALASLITQKAPTKSLMELSGIHKTLQAGEVAVHVVRGVSFAVGRGEILGIVGSSGSGKSTLLGLMGSLDVPTKGHIIFDDVEMTALTETQLTRLRSAKIGFIFQFFNLIPTLTALENVALPIQFARNKQFNPTKRAKELLDMMGLADRMHHRPSQLSGGQQQRIAIARALANNPLLLLGDEPTGSLDSASTEIVMSALREVQRTMHTTIVIVTHSPDVAAQMDRLITIADGRLASDSDPHLAEDIPPVSMFNSMRTDVNQERR